MHSTRGFSVQCCRKRDAPGIKKKSPSFANNRSHSPRHGADRPRNYKGWHRNYTASHSVRMEWSIAIIIFEFRTVGGKWWCGHLLFLFLSSFWVAQWPIKKEEEEEGSPMGVGRPMAFGVRRRKSFSLDSVLFQEGLIWMAKKAASLGGMAFSKAARRCLYFLPKKVSKYSCISEKSCFESTCWE